MYAGDKFPSLPIIAGTDLLIIVSFNTGMNVSSHRRQKPDVCGVLVDCERDKSILKTSGATGMGDNSAVLLQSLKNRDLQGPGALCPCYLFQIKRQHSDFMDQLVQVNGKTKLK